MICKVSREVFMKRRFCFLIGLVLVVCLQLLAPGQFAPTLQVVHLDGLWLPKTPSELKTQRFRAFVRSLCDHDELFFRRPFRFCRLQFSNPCRIAGGDPRASSINSPFSKRTRHLVCDEVFGKDRQQDASASLTNG
jgi:hypothetical protein